MTRGLALDAPLESRAALQVAHAMSRRNEATRWGDAAWRYALWRLTRGPTWNSLADNPLRVAARLFAADGATAAERAQMQTRGARSFVLKLSHGKRGRKTETLRTQEHAITEALALREEMTAIAASARHAYANERCGAIFATHPAFHRALAGDDTSWCRWCKDGAP
jgi:hypothetical protein